MVSDGHYALRQLAKRPGFSALAVLTLALGIGAATAIFSVAYGVLLRPLPFAEPERIVAVQEITTKGRPSRLADPNFADFRDQSRSFQALARYNDHVGSVSGTYVPTRTRIASVSHAFLDVFGVQPILGRGMGAEDDREGAAPVALASYGYWKGSLGAPPDPSQARLRIDGVLVSVIGVLPRGFRFPADVDLWIPAGLDGENPSRTSHNYHAVGRLRDGVSVAQATRDVGAIARRIRESSSERGDYLLADARVVPLREAIAGRARAPLVVLLAAVGFLLLVACANVANLMLAQAGARAHELAIRSALGAPRGRLVRQFLTEALLLSLLGGALGVLLAWWGVVGLVALAPPSLPRLESVSVDLPVLAFALLLTTVVAAGLGAFTAARATARSVRAGLGDAGRGQAGGPGSQRAGRLIVAAQMAITLVLAVGAGLFGRSLMKVLEVDPGFRVDRVLTMDVTLPWVEDEAQKAAQARFFAALVDELGRIPGVSGVGATSGLPLDGGHPDGLFLVMTGDTGPVTPERLEPLFQQKERLGTADYVAATPGYFGALGIPLVRGRRFDERDGASAPHVALVSESLARDRWPREDPIGQTIEFGNMDGDLRLITVVGVVGDTHEYGLDAPPRPTIYVNLLQRPRPAVSVAMRLEVDEAPVARAARDTLRRLDPEVPTRFRMLSQVASAALGPRRFNMVLIGCFALTALLLATTGVFGVMAYAVSRRTREIGVRVALGAEGRDVSRMIVSEALRTILAGVAIGVAGALVLTRSVASLLFGVTATDPATFAGMTVVLVGAGLVACYLPARRAAKVDPVVALRDE